MAIVSKVNGLVITTTAEASEVVKQGSAKFADYDRNVDRERILQQNKEQAEAKEKQAVAEEERVIEKTKPKARTRKATEVEKL